MSPEGRSALSQSHITWQHAQTEHFVYHFTDEKEAQTVYIHAEVYYQWVKEFFGVAEDPWKKKGHIFVFQDPKLWESFNSRVGSGIEGEAFTNGWELFIYRDPFWLAPKKTLAHEITHLIVFRFLEGPIPLCLNEGFAEFVSYRAISAQFGGNEYQVRTLQLLKADQYLPLGTLMSMKSYPEGKVEIFYQESELLVRFLILNYGNKNFYSFLHSVSRGESIEKMIQKIYGMDVAALEEKFREYAIAK